jgi:hypothetical protein
MFRMVRNPWGTLSAPLSRFDVLAGGDTNSTGFGVVGDGHMIGVGTCAGDSSPRTDGA